MKIWQGSRFGVGSVILLACAFLVGNGAWAADPIAPQLKAAIEKSKVKLGDLSSWQEEAFLNEVLASPGRFVRDYSTQGATATKIVVDTDGIKKYLSFHSNQISKAENLKALLAVTATEKCTACVGAVPFVRKDLKDRLEKRGLSVIVLNAVESRRDLSEMSGAKNAMGWVQADIKAVEDVDHPGEIRYDLVLEVRFPGTVVSRVQKQMEVLQNDSIEIGMSRVAIDAMMEMGSRVQAARTGALAGEENPGVEIQIAGVTEYAQLSALKRVLQTSLGSDGRVVERKIRADQSTLAVYSGQSADSLSKILVSAKIDGMKFKLRSASGNEIHGSIQVSSR